MTIFSKPDSEKPYARVRQVERNSWRIDIIVHGCMNYSPDGCGWYCRTEARAIRKGERVLAKYNRKFGNLSAGFTIQ